MDMPKIEMEPKETYLAIGFVFAVILTIVLVNLGYITTPLTLGLIVTLTTVLVLLGHVLVQKGVFAKSTMYVWYLMVFGLAMILYGAIYGGYIPIAFSYGGKVAEVALSNALFYTLLVVAVVGAVLSTFFGYHYFKEEKERVRY